MVNQQISTNTFGCAKWIVSADATQGTHTTIAGALTAASSGDTIFLRDGTYTENPTLKAGVNLAAYNCDASTPNVTIVGNCTLSAAGTVSISGIQLQTNSGNSLTVSGSAASIVYLNNCYFNCTNNTGISYSSSSASSAIHIVNCLGDLGTTGIGLFANSSAGTMFISHSYFTNSGSSTTASTNSAGTVNARFSTFNSCFTTSSTGSLVFRTCTIETAVINTTGVTSAGTGNLTLSNSLVSTGTASALSIGSGTSCFPIDTVLASSNTNAIAGAGTLSYASLSFPSTSSLIQNTLSITARTFDTPSISFDGGVNLLANYTVGTFTPAIQGATTAGTATYAAQNGNYTRIGNRVFYDIYLSWSVATGTGQLQVTGLPFTVNNVSVAVNPITLFEAAVTGATGVMAIPSPSTTLANIASIVQTTGTYAAVSVPATATLVFSGVYNI